MAQPPPQQQPMMEHQREPCPDRIVDDIGGAFAMGAVGGGVWHLIKGIKNSPSGFKLRGGFESLRKESPRLGGSFANWGLTFSVFDCSLQYVRKKEDPWNAIGAGALTGGFLQLRFGLKSAAKSAAFGGFLLAMIEGLGIALSKLTSPPPPGVPFNPAMGGPGGPPGMGPPPPGSPMGLPGMPPGPAPDMGAGMPGGPGPSGAEAGGATGWFSSLFGGGESKPPAPVQVQDLTEDPFKAPPIPTEFQSDKYK